MKTLLLVLAALLSGSISTVFPVDALLVLVVIFCFTMREAKSFAFAFLTGTACDILNPSAAPAAPCYACLGLAQSFSARFVFRVNMFTMLLFVILATFIKSTYLFALAPHPLQFSEIQSAIPGLAGEMGGNILITPLYYFALLKK